MSRLDIFASQAAVAIRATRVARDAARLLQDVLRSIGQGATTPTGIEAVLTAAVKELDRDDDPPFWRLVDGLVRTGRSSDTNVELIAAVLAVVARHRPGPARSARRAR
jgi:hypothetical protein